MSKRNSGTVTVKRGDTWSKMLQALGSNKPWVSRSLRSWGVAVSRDGIYFVWGPIRYWGHATCRVNADQFNAAAAYIMFGNLPGSIELHVGVFDGQLRTCDKDDPARAFSLSTTWVSFSFGDQEMRIPTKLVIEALRLMRHRLPNSRSDHYPKAKRRKFCRYESMRRKDKKLALGSHERWSNIGRFVRMVQESQDIKQVDLGESTPEKLKALKSLGVMPTT